MIYPKKLKIRRRIVRTIVIFGILTIIFCLITSFNTKNKTEYQEEIISVTLNETDVQNNEEQTLQNLLQLVESSNNSEIITKEELPSPSTQIEEDIVIADIIITYDDNIPLSSELQKVVHDECAKYNINPAIIFGLIDVESDFDSSCVTPPYGCYGLMQLHPKYFPSDLAPADNIRVGIEYLASKIDKYDGDIMAALTAYNAGHDTGKRWYANLVMEDAINKYGY